MLQIEFEYDEDRDVAVLRPKGDIDAYSVAEFRQDLHENTSQNRLVVDLSHVMFMDSAGLGALIGGVRRIREHNGSVTLCSSRQPILRLLHTTGFNRIVPVRDNLNEAITALDEDS